jgi:hypothetical protein
LSFATGALPVGSYKISYAYAGESNFRPAANGTSTLTVVPLAVPNVTGFGGHHTQSKSFDTKGLRRYGARVGLPPPPLPE